MEKKFKVVCINNKPIKNKSPKTQNLTIGKVYETSEDPEIYGDLLVVNDVGESVNYFGGRFISLEKWREMKLNEILK